MIRRDGILMLSFLQCKPAPLIREYSLVPGRVKRNVRQWEKRLLILVKTLEYRLIVVVMLPIHVTVSLFKESAVVSGQFHEPGRRHEEVSAAVSNLVLHVSLFPSGFGIHELIAEPIVLTEPEELIRQLAAPVFQDLRDKG